MSISRWVLIPAGLLWLAGCQSTGLTAAKLYLKQEKPQQAKAQLESALQVQPDNPEVHYLLGKIAGTERRYAEMVRYFERSLEIGPRFQQQIRQQRRYYWALLYNRGVGENSAKDPDLAQMREFFRLATVVQPGRLEAWRNLAFAQYRQEEYEAAIQTYRLILDRAPADTSSYNSLGALYYHQDRLDEAAGAYTKLLELDSRHIGALTNLAVIYVEQDRLSEAESAYRKSIEIDPDSWEGHYNLGNLYWRKKNYAAARDAFSSALDLSPKHDDSRFNLAITYIALEDLDSALPFLEQLSVDTPDNRSVWRELGRIYAIKDMVNKSEEAYARAEAAGD